MTNKKITYLKFLEWFNNQAWYSNLEMEEYKQHLIKKRYEIIKG